MAKDWTAEQKDNAMKWALCRACGTPREVETAVEMKDGKIVVTHSLVCPNGHPQP